MPFLWEEKKENEVIELLNEFAKGKEVIPISLDGFGCFPPRVIFISVAENKKLDLFQKQLEKYCKVELNLFNAQYKDTPFHPHLTLAFRDLKKIRFAEAWNEFKEKPFSGSFETTGFTLLKHDGNAWQPLRQFHF